ncbi:MULTISPECIES: hypothetical protein [Pseudoalteromonas]|uniref:hypothetical protein n=1 Tax=Pseudoalteromonas TaxID=53246 RepID=UPI00029B0427|nr:MULTISPECIES: hypothetical protein [Pseudoalteromonas]QZO11381.1 hypothetical protein K5642_09485 [Pseudoalteromonas piscicida]
MRIIIRILALVALCISCAWLYFERSFEPALTTVVSLSALISTFFFDTKSEEASGQAQSIGKHATGIQAGGDVSINIGSTDKKDNS